MNIFKIARAQLRASNDPNTSELLADQRKQKKLYDEEGKPAISPPPQRPSFAGLLHLREHELEATRVTEDSSNLAINFPSDDVTADLRETESGMILGDSEERVASVQKYTSTLPTTRSYWKRWLFTAKAFACTSNIRCARCSSSVNIRHGVLGLCGNWPVICPVCEDTYCRGCYGSRSWFYNKGCYKCVQVVEHIEYLHAFVLGYLEQGVYTYIRALSKLPPDAVPAGNAFRSSSTNSATAVETLWHYHRPHHAFCGNPNVTYSFDELLPVDKSLSAIPFDIVQKELVMGSYGWLHYDVDLNIFKFRSLHRPRNVPILEVSIPLSAIIHVASLKECMCVSYMGSSVAVCQFKFCDDTTCSDWTFYTSLTWDILMRERCYSL